MNPDHIPVIICIVAGLLCFKVGIIVGLHCQKYTSDSEESE